MPVVTAATVGLLLTACGSAAPTSPSGVVRIDFDFNNGPQGWTADQANYLVSFGRRALPTAYRALPVELDASRRGLFLDAGGENLFTFYKGRATGVRAQAFYRVSFDVEIATNTSPGCVGAGGPPGEGTFVKAGASTQEPSVIPIGPYYRLNIDVGLGSLDGADAMTLGNIANTFPCQFQNGVWIRRWEFKQLSSGAATLHVQSAGDGSLWFLVGTDQIFFSPLPLYYTRFIATLTPD
jgi:hypothetical protein